MIDRLAARVRSGATTAVAEAEAALARIAAHNPALVAVTRITAERARAEARAVDATVAAGGDPGPLAGIPYVVKDLFDVAGLPTTAGAGMRRDAPPAATDAEAIVRLRAAGAVLIGTTTMDEFAYGFATINATDGTTRNPHDLARLAGGSSGGSAAAVAGGIAPFSLGSDTNGSIRVPAGLTGLYGLKPTHGGLPMAGVFPFVEAFDDIGPFATSLADLRLVWEVLGGVAREGELSHPHAVERAAVLGGWFGQNLDPELPEGIAAIGRHLGAPTVELSGARAARSAAFVMSAAEGGWRHLPELHRRALAFDPQVRDRLIAGAMVPAAALFAAQAFRERFRAEAAALFERFDVLIAPSAPCVAPSIADPTIVVDGARVPARAQLGLHCQPISCIGLPVLAAPLKRPGRLPLGVQLIGAWGQEERLFACAEALAAAGLTGVSEPPFP